MCYPVDRHVRRRLSRQCMLLRDCVRLVTVGAIPPGYSCISAINSRKRRTSSAVISSCIARTSRTESIFSSSCSH